LYLIFTIDRSAQRPSGDSAGVWGTRLGEGRGLGLAEVNFPRLPIGKFSGRALAGSNESRRSRRPRWRTEMI